jgi:hypothetical protein
MEAMNQRLYVVTDLAQSVGLDVPMVHIVVLKIMNFVVRFSW